MPVQDPNTAAERVALLERLHDNEGRTEEEIYLQRHATTNAIRRHVDVFERYREHVPSSGRVLDWGCFHAPDSCLLRSVFGDAVELHGCDFRPAGTFPTFHGHAGLEYRPLQDPFALPYDDGMFAAVIGSGVIEHTANDSVSLRELYRVLADDGVLILTFIPNRYSYTEFLGRRMHNGRTHSRLYGMTEIRRMLLHHGFLPIEHGYHQMVPRTGGGELASYVWRFNAALERAWPLNRLASNLMVVARRRQSM